MIIEIIFSGQESGKDFKKSIKIIDSKRQKLLIKFLGKIYKLEYNELLNLIKKENA